MMKSLQRAFTLIELMIVVAVIAVVVTLAAPSLHDFILMQRLKSVSANIVTDLQFARAEAAARNLPVRVRFSNNLTQTCYTVYIAPTPGTCRCFNTPVCTSAGTEIRTINIPRNLSVLISPTVAPADFSYDPTTGAMITASLDFTRPADPSFVVDVCIDQNDCFNKPKRLRTEIRLSGRPGVCAPAGSTMRNVPAC